MAENMHNAAQEAINATKKATAAGDRDVFQMGSTDQTNTVNLAVALLQWDAVRMETEARKAEAEAALAKLKGRG